MFMCELFVVVLIVKRRKKKERVRVACLDKKMMWHTYLCIKKETKLYL